MRQFTYAEVHSQNYQKAVLTSMTFVTSSYLAFSLVVYACQYSFHPKPSLAEILMAFFYRLDCGQYVASPALGSAGPLLKKIACAVKDYALF